MKGKVESDLEALKLPVLTFYRPGLIIGRQNDFRLIEASAFFIPYMPRIDAEDLGYFIL